jgi:hypothetical protein
MKLVLGLVLSLPFWLFGEEYRADSLKVTDAVRQFVAKHQIAGSDLEIVHKILEITHDPFLFIKIDRPMLKTWIRDPALVESFRAGLIAKKKKLAELDELRLKKVLSEKEFKERRDLTRDVFNGDHNLRVYENLLRKKTMRAEDLAFVVSGSEAIEHRVQDGCTTMAHVFIALAKAAGLKDVRFLVGANVSEFLQACPRSGPSRVLDVEIDGHMVALVKIDKKWSLVNCTYFEPFSLDESTRYEILTPFEGEDIVPEKLRGKVLRLPSFQRENFPPSELLIAGVGKDADDDLEVENHKALMNLSVSGDPGDAMCRWTIPVKK